jgi:hypothetical protein
MPEVHGTYFQGEDRVVEWLTFVFFLSGSILSFLTLLYSNEMNKVAKWYFILMGLFLFLCAGEEISWGQRIFGFATPENIELVNEQSEFNLHNLRMKHIHPYGIFSSIMFVYGIIIPLSFFRRLKGRTSAARRYIPPLMLVPCFLFPIILGSLESLPVLLSIDIPRRQYIALTKELSEMYWGLSVFLASAILLLNNRRIQQQPLSHR